MLMRIIGIIPARYQSSRFPGKPLADICGKPMIWWVYQQAIKSQKLGSIVVATDDIRIEEMCRQYGMNVLMTSSNNKTAADRMYEVSKSIDAEFYVSINGDEPMIAPVAIDAAVPESAPLDIEYGTNSISLISDPIDLMDPTNIKVVFNHDMDAVYMSRTPIPFPYAGLDCHYHKHLGVIGYNRKMLEFYHDSVPGKLEKAEGIDTLRFIDYGKKLKFCLTEAGGSLSVDTPKDLQKVISLIKTTDMSKKGFIAHEF